MNRRGALVEDEGHSSGKDSDEPGEFGDLVFLSCFNGNMEVFLFAESWRIFLRGVGGRTRAIKRYDDSTSSDDGHS